MLAPVSEPVRIPLTRGLEALIDQSDFALVSQHKWHARKSSNGKTWYASTWIRRDGKRVRIHMHRLIVGIPDGPLLVDHFDGCGIHNCRANLRIATTSQNTLWMKREKKPAIYRGVSRHMGGKWHARICVKGKHINLGLHDTAELAAEAYRKAASELAGEFARTA